MDDGVPIRTRLGLRLADKPSLREIARRLSYCNSVAAAGQPEMSFLGETDILLGARLDLDEDQTLVAEQTAPVHKRQGDLFSKRRRGSADEVLLRAIEERQEVRQTVAKGAAVAREVQEQVGAAMNGLAAEDLPAELERIERRMQADTQPARSFIAA